MSSSGPVTSSSPTIAFYQLSAGRSGAWQILPPVPVASAAPTSCPVSPLARVNHPSLNHSFGCVSNSLSALSTSQMSFAMVVSFPFRRMTAASVP